MLYANKFMFEIYIKQGIYWKDMNMY